MQCHILIIGTGSLAASTCYALSALIGGDPLNVCIVGRDRQKAANIAAIAQGRANCFGSSHVFSADKIVWEDKPLEKLFVTHRPDLIFMAASLQSAWESMSVTTAWSQLIQQAGYACTLPFQTYLVLQVATTLKKSGLPTQLINACYPDAVNAFLHTAGLNVLCGIGNIGILYANLKCVLPHGDIRVLAHHAHLTKAIPQFNADNLKVWIGQKSLKNLPKKKTLQILSVKDQELNHLTGSIAGHLLRDLSYKKPTLHHVPGPLGLQGGYPVQISNYSLSIHLPSSYPLEKAIAQNLHWSYLDGVVIESDGFARFSPKTQKALADFGNIYNRGFHIDDLDKVCRYYNQFREKLRLKKVS